MLLLLLLNAPLLLLFLDLTRTLLYRALLDAAVLLLCSMLDPAFYSCSILLDAAVLDGALLLLCSTFTLLDAALLLLCSILLYALTCFTLLDPTRCSILICSTFLDYCFTLLSVFPLIYSAQLDAALFTLLLLYSCSILILL